MIFLFLAILCSSSIALIFKYSEGKRMNRYAITSMNYFTAFTIGFIISIQNNLFVFDKLSIRRFVSEFNHVLFENKCMFTHGSSMIWSIFVGTIAGVFFFLAFIFYQKSVKENGAGLSGMFGKLGILVPMIFSIILWQEYPTFIQWIGILLAIVSIVLVNIRLDMQSIKDIKLTLIVLFLFMGLAEFSNKFFQKYAINDYKSLFLFFVFFTAFLISAIVTKKKKKSVRKRDILIGILVGIPNLFSSYFLIMSLKDIKTSVAFPMFSAGGIVVIALGGVIIYGERLQRKEILAICMTIIALILINL